MEESPEGGEQLGALQGAQTRDRENQTVSGMLDKRVEVREEMAVVIHEAFPVTCGGILVR